MNTTFNVPAIENWNEFLAAAEAGGTAAAQLKIMQDALRAFNRLEKAISYSEHMSYLIDFGEFTGSIFDDEREATHKMVCERFGIESEEDLSCLYGENYETGQEAYHASQEPRYYHLIIHPSKLKREYDNLDGWEGVTLLKGSCEDIYPQVCVKYRRIQATLRSLRFLGIKAQLDDGSDDMPDEGFFGPDSDPIGSSVGVIKLNLEVWEDEALLAVNCLHDTGYNMMNGCLQDGSNVWSWDGLEEWDEEDATQFRSELMDALDTCGVSSYQFSLELA
jgi:hypothetical protein